MPEPLRIEGEHVETDDYFFCKLGDSIPLIAQDDPIYDTNAIPSKPLALSPRSGLIFAAHSSGFCVAKTKDVIVAAKEIKAKGSNCSVQELSVVDVDIGRVSILALSEDSGYVSAVVKNEIHFFSVNSLLNKDKKPTFSCSVVSNHVKDMLWIKDSEQSFIVVTDRGEMYHGAIDKPLTRVMEKVDAVEKSVDGRCLAIGRKNNLTIFSSQFKEILQIGIPLDSFTPDNTASDTVKVESIRWVREDSIVVGCLQQTEGSEEENYFLQVIMSEDGKFINDSSAATAVQFNDLFPGIVDDIVPYGCGPHLFMNYLENCEFAFVSNRKSIDQHIMLLSWSQGDNRVSVLDIERDSWLPRIELQENGDDNLVLGLCVDEASVYENVEVEIGANEQRELRPHCLLVCLTLEGKLVMFNVASISGCQRSRQTSSSLSDDVQNKAVVSHSNLGEGSQSEEAKREKAKQFGTVVESHESNSGSNNSAPDDPVVKDPTKDRNSNVTLSFERNLSSEPVDGNDGHRALMDANISKSSGNSENSLQETSTQYSSKDSRVQLVGTEKWRIASSDKFLEKSSADTNKGEAVKTGSGVLHGVSTPIGSQSNTGPGISNARCTVVESHESNSGSNNSAPDDPVVKDPTKNRNSNVTLSFERNLSSEPVDGNDGQRALMDANISKPSGNSENSLQETPTQYSSKDSRAQLVGTEKWKIASSDKFLEKSSADTNKGEAVNTGSGVLHGVSTPIGSQSNTGPGISNARCTVVESRESNSGSNNSAPDDPVVKDLTKNRNSNVTLSFERNLSSEPVDGNDGQRALMDANISKPSGNSENSQQETSTQYSSKDSRSQLGGTEKWKIASSDKLLEKNGQRALMDANISKPFGNSENSLQETSTQYSSKDSRAQLVGTEKWRIASSDKFLKKSSADTNKGEAVKTGSGVLHGVSTPIGSQSNTGPGISNARSPSFLPTSTSTKSNVSGFPLTSTNTANNNGTFAGNLGIRPSDSFSSSIGKAANVNQTMTSSEQNSIKQFDNVENIAKELDKLLEGIEETGGFRDVFTSAHRSSLEALEEGMRNLSERSRGLQSISEEQLKGTELLLDKTVQVLARKTHMEGIVRQTTDGQYWDMWNRQKLSSELDHKQQTILSLYQDLVNKMIELEKHFNTLELNLFGESSGANLASRALNCRSATPRHSQSLNAIHNATVSQLAAAEQLSDMLSRQMDVLSVKSPSSKKSSVKNKVFETIGIPCPDDNLNPTNMAKMFDSPPNKSATHNEFRRSQLSGGGSEFETSRRRRDSLDRNWAKFEAPKTTVKRMPVQNEQQNGRGLFSSMDKQLVKPFKIEASLASHSKNPSVEDSNGGKDSYENLSSDTIATSASFKWAGAIPETTQLQAQQYLRSSPVQGNNFLDVQNTSATLSPAPSLSSSLSSFRNTDVRTEKGHGNAERSGSHVGYMGNLDAALVDQKVFGSQWGLGMSTNQNTQPRPTSPLMKFSHIPSIIETKLTKPDDKSSSNELTSKHDQFLSSSGTVGYSASSSSLFPTLSAKTLPVVSAEGGYSFGSSPGVSKTTTVVPDVGSNAPTKQSTAFSLPSLSFSDTGGINGIRNTTTALTEKQSTAFSIPPVSLSKLGDTGSGENISEATIIAQEDEMEEVAPETNQSAGFSLGSLAGFGIGSAVSAPSNRSNPFGVSLSSTPQSTTSSSPFTVPQGQLFRPASFSFPSPVPQQSQSSTIGATSGAFGSATSQQPPAASGFGQPGQIGFGGQQALGCVLGSFGQSRQIGAGLPGSGFGGVPSSGGFLNAAGGGGSGGGGFAAPTGGFAGSGFAAAAPGGGGFAAAAPGGGGFAAAAPGGGGFAAASSGGGGFGAFSNQGTGGFSALGPAATGGRQPPSELFTLMRR